MIILSKFGNSKSCHIGSRIGVAHEIYQSPEYPSYRGNRIIDAYSSIIIHISGNVIYSNASQSFKGEFLDIFTTAIDEPYSIEWDRTSPYERLAIYFDLNTFENTFYGDNIARDTYLEFIDHKKHPCEIHLSDEHKEELSSIIQDYDKLLGNNDLSTVYKVFSITTRLFELMYRALNPEEKQTESLTPNDITQKAKKLIDENYTQLSSALEVAQHLYITPTYLSKKFTEKMGISPKAYLLDKKLNHSRNMIKCGASITEAAIESGFCNTSYFIQIYKKKFGKTPNKSK